MDRLEQQLRRIDGRGYKAYKSIAGEYPFHGFRLLIDHVQADPYAAPSRFRAIVDPAVSALPASVFRSEPRQRAARDFIARSFRRATGGEKAVRIDAGQQTVLERTAVLFSGEEIELRFTVELPGRGRSILGEEARRLICERLPGMVLAAATAEQLDLEAMEQHMASVEDQVALREGLAERGLVAFVGEGASLPRRSGVDDRPLDEAIAFTAPDSLVVELPTPNHGSCRGMGIRRGINLIVGGGFHGKSTLLAAIALGVYDHIPGDGREQVVTDPLAVKIRAEDGRAVHRVDLSPYINQLPYGKDTHRFSTALASGSTSQAAALQEALETGAATVLVDEDTSATNFMIRDRRMQALVAKDQEPITPFIDRIRQLRDELGVSTLLVMGGSGDYFDCADAVIQMQDYLPFDVTDKAHAIAREFVTGRTEEAASELTRSDARALIPGQLDPEAQSGKRKLQARGCDTLVFGKQSVDLRSVEQLTDPSQVRTIALVLARLSEEEGSGLITLPVQRIAGLLQEAPWERLPYWAMGDLALPRVTEVMAALNRLRGEHFAGSGDRVPGLKK